MIIQVPNTQITLSAEQLAEVALSTIRAAIGDVKYQYLSGPITGGKRFLKWHCSTGHNLSDEEYKSQRDVAVKSPNIIDLKIAAVAERLAGNNTIEPGSFEADVKNWGQKEFLYFWQKVIEEHAGCVRFMDGWAYSAGCVFEYYCAMRFGLRTCDMQGNDLGLDKALPLLDVALDDIWAHMDVSIRRNAPLAELYDKILGLRMTIAELQG